MKPERPAHGVTLPPRESDAAADAHGGAVSHPSPGTQAPGHVRPWWHSKTVEEFRDDLKTLDAESVQLVLDEIEVTIPILQAVAQDRSAPEDRRTRASYALAYYRQKAVHCRAELRARAKARRLAGQEQFARHEAARGEIIAKARNAVARGQYGTAITMVLDLFEKKVGPRSPDPDPE